MSAWIWEKSYPTGVSWAIDIPARPVYDVLDKAVANWPKSYAIDFLGKRLKFADLGDLVDRAAKGFQLLGVKKGIHVGLFLPNTPHYIIAFFAILKAGGTVVNYSPLDAEKELEHKIQDSDTDFIVTLDLRILYPRVELMLHRTRLKKLIVGNLADFLPFPKNLLFPFTRRKDVVSVREDAMNLRFHKLIGNDGRYDQISLDSISEQVAVIQYTGGTTGTPKGAMLTHRNLIAATEQFQAWSNSEPALLEEASERILTVLPLFHIYALTVILLNGVAAGAELLLHLRFEIDTVINDLKRKRPTVFPGVPTMYTGILNHENAQQTDLASLKVCNSGGAPLPPELQRRFEEHSGCRLVEGWGMTETCSPGTSNHIHMVYKEGSAGVPLPGIVIEITDVDDPEKLLPQGEKGEICITGPNVMRGYWNKPEDTASAFRGGRFHTGDIGYLDEDGYIFIVDRMKDMIISSGYNVYPRNIEDAIYQHPGVAECTVIGIQDEYRGQAAKAFITLKEGVSPLSLDELHAFLNDKLGRHEMPSALDIRKELPKTLIGKLSKKELYAEEEERVRT